MVLGADITLAGASRYCATSLATGALKPQLAVSSGSTWRVTSAVGLRSSSVEDPQDTVRPARRRPSATHVP